MSYPTCVTFLSSSPLNTYSLKNIYTIVLRSWAVANISVDAQRFVCPSSFLEYYHRRQEPGLSHARCWRRPNCACKSALNSQQVPNPADFRINVAEGQDPLVLAPERASAVPVPWCFSCAEREQRTCGLLPCTCCVPGILRASACCVLSFF